MNVVPDFTITINDSHALLVGSTQSRFITLVWTAARMAAASVTIALLIAYGPLAQAQIAGAPGTMAAGANPAAGAVNPWTPVCASGATVEGIDVTVFQGTMINWNTVSTTGGKKFAYARVSDGGFLDTTFATNYPAIKAAGMLRGGLPVL